MEASDTEEFGVGADQPEPPIRGNNELLSLAEEDNQVNAQPSRKRKGHFARVSRISPSRWRSFWAHRESTMKRRKSGSTTGGRGWASLRMLLLLV